MLYAINVLKKDYNEREELYFLLKIKKKCEYWNMYVCKAHPELCFVWWNLSATTARNSPHICVLDRCHIYFFYYALSIIFSNHSVGGNLLRLCLCVSSAQRMFVVRTLCIPPWIICTTTVAAATAAAAVLKPHNTTLTAWLVLTLCFFGNNTGVIMWL